MVMVYLTILDCRLSSRRLLRCGLVLVGVGMMRVGGMKTSLVLNVFIAMDLGLRAGRFDVASVRRKSIKV